MESVHKLYTLIIDFKGGTFITQALADDILSASKKCLANWDITDISALICDSDISKIVSEIDEDYFIEVSNMQNVWCASLNIGRNLMLLNLVETNNAT